MKREQSDSPFVWRIVVEAATNQDLESYHMRVALSIEAVIESECTKTRAVYDVAVEDVADMFRQTRLLVNDDYQVIQSQVVSAVRRERVTE